jgi:hypothetical protein
MLTELTDSQAPMRETINRSSISRAVLHERGRAIADAIAEAITLITLNKRVDRREANRTR